MANLSVIKFDEINFIEKKALYDTIIKTLDFHKKYEVIDYNKVVKNDNYNEFDDLSDSNDSYDSCDSNNFSESDNFDIYNLYDLDYFTFCVIDKNNKNKIRAIFKNDKSSLDQILLMENTNWIDTLLAIINWVQLNEPNAQIITINFIFKMVHHKIIEKIMKDLFNAITVHDKYTPIFIISTKSFFKGNFNNDEKINIKAYEDYKCSKVVFNHTTNFKLLKYSRYLKKCKCMINRKIIIFENPICYNDSQLFEDIPIEVNFKVNNKTYFVNANKYWANKNTLRLNKLWREYETYYENNKRYYIIFGIELPKYENIYVGKIDKLNYEKRNKYCDNCYDSFLTNEMYDFSNFFEINKDIFKFEEKYVNNKKKFKSDKKCILTEVKQNNHITNVGSNYIIYEREFIKTKENIYKIGKTKQDNIKRLNQYPKGSILMIQKYVNNCDSIEKEIIKIFDSKFINRKDIGREYYEGNYDEMEKSFLNIIDSNKM